MDSQQTCPYCKADISPLDFFCPNCGKKLKEKPLSITLVSQILIYLLSFFLPPLGLWPAIKYLRQPDDKSKKIGLIAIALTIISIAASVWFTISFINSLIIDSFSFSENQLNLLQDLGY